MERSLWEIIFIMAKDKNSIYRYRKCWYREKHKERFMSRNEWKAIYFIRHKNQSISERIQSMAYIEKKEEWFNSYLYKLKKRL